MKSSKLDTGVTTFIRQKVQKLGSIDAVNRLYSRDCAVDNYARQVAQEMFFDINNLNAEYSTATSVIKTEPKARKIFKYQSEINTKKKVNNVDIFSTNSKTSTHYCISCGLPIPSERLQAVPGTKHCVDCQKEKELNKGHQVQSKKMFCPRCKRKGIKSLLVWRTARDPSVRSSYFLGCSRYPKCRYVDK